MTEKKAYRKVKVVVKEAVENGSGLTVDEVATQTGFLKWYVKKVLTGLVSKGVIVEEDGKFKKKEG